MTPYLSHWNLEFSPYRHATEAYPAPPLSEAISRIEYLVYERRSLGALLAPTGMGKSTLLAAVAQRLGRSRCQVVRVDAFGISTRELLWQIACGLEAQPAMGDGVSRLWQRLSDLATEQGWQQRPALVLIDDAGQTSPDIYQQLIRLTRIAEQAHAAWTVVLAATPSEATRWPERLRDLVDLRIELSPWQEETTVDYLQHALLSAGHVEPVFTEDALRHLHRLAEGTPRLIARLADASLVVGADAGVAIVDTGIVESALAQVTWATTSLAG